MYNHLNLSKILLIFFLIPTLISCGENSSNKNYAEYDHLGIWTLRANNSTILSDDSTSYEGDFSIKVNNKDCNSLRLITNFPVEENEDYEISVAVRLQHSNSTKAGVPSPFEDGLAVLVEQAGNVILSQTANIYTDDIWAIKIFSFTTESNEPIEISFMPGCDLSVFWIDSFSLNCTNCND